MQLVAGPITLSQDSPVDLSGPHPVIVLNGLTNPLSGGETVQLTLDFANAGPVTLMVPVEPAAYDLRDLLPAADPNALGGHRRAPAQGQVKTKTKVKVTAELASPTASASPSAAP